MLNPTCRPAHIQPIQPYDEYNSITIRTLYVTIVQHYRKMTRVWIMLMLGVAAKSSNLHPVNLLICINGNLLNRRCSMLFTCRFNQLNFSRSDKNRFLYGNYIIIFKSVPLEHRHLRMLTPCMDSEHPDLIAIERLVISTVWGSI